VACASAQFHSLLLNIAEEAILNEEKTTMEEKMRILEGLP